MQKIVAYINRHKTVTFVVAFMITAFVLGSNITRDTPDHAFETRASGGASQFRTAGSGGVAFTPWNVAKAVTQTQTRAEKPYTIMIYMNGSDLESETAAATLDLVQMLESGLDAKNAHVVLFTGGTKRWQNDLIPENSCVLWEIAEGDIAPLADIGLRNMGDAGTLTGFIEYAMACFPAEKYGLIMWDHGGGSIAGYGHDEKFNNATLSLADMERAFYEAGLADRKLEFLGFDSCLMSTIEMAVVAADYAKYMIASEDLSPGEGWDYAFLRELNEAPHMSGAALGKAIGEYFMAYYEGYDEDILNISVVDLSKAAPVMEAMGALMSRCSESLLADRAASFTTLAHRRDNTRTFGGGSPRDNESDMVDIGDMARNLYDLYPAEAERVFATLDDSVVYNRNNAGMALGGLSTYYVYGGREWGKESLDVYAGLNMDANYTGYLNQFYRYLARGGTYRSGTDIRRVNEVTGTSLTAWKPIEGGYYMTGILIAEAATGQGTLWPEIYGEKVCMYEINQCNDSRLYAIPAELDGRDCNIVAIINAHYPNGKILGARNAEEFVIQKGYDDVEAGSVIAFYYQAKNITGADKDEWHKGRAMTVSETGMTIDWKPNDRDTQYSLRITDIYGDESYEALGALHAGA